MSLPPVGLYLHVPFCVSLCPYCDFVVYTGGATRGPRARVEAFVRAVLVELDLRADELDARFGSPGSPASAGSPGAAATTRDDDVVSGLARAPLASVYLGGGTPSLLPAADVADLLDRIERRFGLETGAEVTIEANPGPDERGDLAGFRAAGVNRISFGAQSLEAAELRRLGRRHRPEDVLDAIEAARRAGIAQRSVDLLYDVPGQSMATWQATVERALDAPIDHLSAYALTLDDPQAAGLAGALGDHLPVRPGARRWRRAAAAEQDDDRAADAYLWLDERLVAAGFTWYEISNWARPGGASRHNQAYWRRWPMIGLGPGAHGFDGDRERSWNAARLDGYLGALIPGQAGATPDPGRGTRRLSPGPQRLPARTSCLPPGGTERLDDDAVRLETISLSLRTSEGVALRDLPARAGPTIGAAQAAGLVEPLPHGRLRLTPRGRLLGGEMAVELSR